MWGKTHFGKTVCVNLASLVSWQTTDCLAMSLIKKNPNCSWTLKKIHNLKMYVFFKKEVISTWSINILFSFSLYWDHVCCISQANERINQPFPSLLRPCILYYPGQWAYQPTQAWPLDAGGAPQDLLKHVRVRGHPLPWGRHSGGGGLQCPPVAEEDHHPGGGKPPTASRGENKQWWR